MARFKSISFSQVKGSLGGLTFQSSLSLQVVRTRTSPSVKRSVTKSLVGSKFVYIAQRWSVLSDAERGQWNRFAAITRQGVGIGQGGRLSGYQLYVMRNATQQQYQIGLIRDPVIPSTQAAVIGLVPSSFTSSSMQITVTIENGNSSVFYLQIDMSLPYSRGVSRIRNSAYKRVVSNLAGISNVVSLISYYRAIYGNLPSSLKGKVFFRARVVHRATAITSQWVYGYSNFN